jgi:hypothetical protein
LTLAIKGLDLENCSLLPRDVDGSEVSEDEVTPSISRGSNNHSTSPIEIAGHIAEAPVATALENPVMFKNSASRPTSRRSSIGGSTIAEEREISASPCESKDSIIDEKEEMKNSSPEGIFGANFQSPVSLMKEWKKSVQDVGKDAEDSGKAPVHLEYLRSRATPRSWIE